MTFRLDSFLDELPGRFRLATGHSRHRGMLGHDVIHSVNNPIPRRTGAIHVYGGDFFNANRKEWDPETLCERACDVDRPVNFFEEENRRWAQ